MVSRSDDETTALQGGVSVDFQCASEDTDVWAPRDWVLRGVKGTPDESLQVQRDHYSVVVVILPNSARIDPVIFQLSFEPTLNQ
jgi:hypothetical protein